MLTRFIFICAGIFIGSLAALPVIGVFQGISEERANILASNETKAPETQNDEITFAEIYAMAEESPQDLNEIEPAAGEIEDSFTGGFSDTAHPALGQTPTAAEFDIEEDGTE